MPASNRLPQHLRDCIAQTVAAEALEGWQPTDEQLDALTALVNGDVTFETYLAAYRSRYHLQPATETTRRTLRRQPAYLIPGTSVLRNNFGANTHNALADLEFVATAGRIAGWHRRLTDGQVGAGHLDVRTIHRQLFADVYAWAGSYRVTELRLGDDVFARRSAVLRMMNHVEARWRELATHETDRDDLADQLARLYADYNYVHPFREGNGRTGTLMLHIVTTLRGRRLDLGAISRAEWYAASRESMPARRNRPADHRPLIPLLARVLG